MRNILTILFLFTCLATYGQTIKISELPAANTLGGTEVVLGVQSGDNRKISINQIKTFVWDLAPTLSTGDTIGYVLVRRTSDGKVFRRSLSSLSYWPLAGAKTLTDDVQINGADKNVTFDNIGNFEILGSTGSVNWFYENGADFTNYLQTANAILIDVTDDPVENELDINSFGIRLQTTSDLNLVASNHINIDAGGDVKLNGVSGTSGEFIGNVDGHLVWSVPPGSGGSSSSAVLDVETTQVGNITTGEDVLYTYTLPADTLNTNGEFIRGRISGIVANNANVKSIKLKFGGTTFMTRGTTTPTIGQGYTIDWEVIRTGATTQKCNATFSGSDGIASAYYSIAGETLSGTVAIVLTGEATATDDIIKHSSVVTFGLSAGGGVGGDLSLSDFVTSETLNGTVDGVNDDFTVDHTPAGFFHLYVNGLLQEEGGGNDYTRTGPNITMTSPPAPGSILTSSYIK